MAWESDLEEHQDEDDGNKYVSLSRNSADSRSFTVELAEDNQYYIS